MQLTTLARVKSWVPFSVNSTQHDALLRAQIAAVSRKLEEHIRRHVEVKARTEDYTVDQLSRRFWLRAAPVYTTSAIPDERQPSLVVAAAPSLKYAELRDFASVDAEDPLEYYFHARDGSVEYDWPINFTGYRNPGALRATYTGGLAYTLDSLVASSLTGAGTVSVGDAVTGQTSGATGTVTAHTPLTSITVTVLSGTFVVGERIAKTSDVANYATFTAFTNSGQPLCMAYPELVEACNMQVAALFMRREQLGIQNVSNEGVSITVEKPGKLLQGVQEIVEHLVRYGVTY